MIDVVCGMQVDDEAAERARLVEESGGARYAFCSATCRDAFRMSPSRFIKRDADARPTGYCELCLKAIAQGEASASVLDRGVLHRFCCQTCAGVFLGRVPVPSGPSASTDARGAAEAADRLQASPLLAWLKAAVDKDASDLFVSVGEAPKMKIYGAFRPLPIAPLSREDVDGIVEAILPTSRRELFTAGREIDMALEAPGISRFRVNIFREQRGLAIAFRPVKDRAPSLAELRLPEMLENLTQCTRGLILVTGPAGSGKSTTMAAMVEAINRRDQRHIITIEDPIEYLMRGERSIIHQRELDAHTRSFGDALRAAMREHPDVIMVGELRDRESMGLAIRAAETGHLVLGTLHSGTVVQAITRVIDTFEADLQSQVRVQFAQSLQAIIAQRLLRRVDAPGMLAATEILIATTAIKSLIRRNAIHEIRGYIELGQQMHSLEASIRRLIREGIVGADALDTLAGSPTLVTR